MQGLRVVGSFLEGGALVAQSIFIPKLGMAMKEGKVAEWKAKEGEWVEDGSVVLIIETEKVAHEIVAEVSGFLVILAQVGDVLPCGEAAGILAETQEEFDQMVKDRPVPAKLDELEESAEKPAVASKTAARSSEEKRIKISPVARRIAEEHGIDITQITGTGPEGRIVKGDIQNAIKQKEEGVAPEPGVMAATPAGEVVDGKRVKQTIPITGMREAIAKHMHHSLSVSAQLTLMTEIDMTEMVRVRKNLIKQADSIGIRISYTDLFIFVVAKALKELPILNSSLIDNEIKIWEDINIGFATALEMGENESGLVVPVVRNADKKSLVEISKSRKELMDKAREGKLAFDDMVGGTFTITNAGVIGNVWAVSTPIINQPESAILGTTSITERPVVEDGQIVIRPIMPVSLTFDHRIIDGIPAAKFTVKLRELMGNTGLLLL